MITKGKFRVFVAGHHGMVGSAIVRQLAQDPDIEILVRSRNELDLTNQVEVSEFFSKAKVDQVYLAAAKVGGIHANNVYPAEFIYQNLMMECNVVNSAFVAGVKKLLFLGSSCIYPKLARQPMSEEELLTGPLEPTNEPYAIAKIAGLKLCESYNRQYGKSHGIEYRSVMPTNLYGPGDNYHSMNSHVIPSLLRKFHHAKVEGEKSVEVWGTGKALREFLHVDDMASACVHVMGLERDWLQTNFSPMCSHINVGSGEEISIQDLAAKIKKVVEFSGSVYFDKTKPDGAPRKLLASSRLYRSGWKPKISLEVGLIEAYRDYVARL